MSEQRAPQQSILTWVDGWMKREYFSDVSIPVPTVEDDRSNGVDTYKLSEIIALAVAAASLPESQPRGVELIDHRTPTADEIRRGLELEPEALAALERNKVSQPDLVKIALAAKDAVFADPSPKWSHGSILPGWQAHENLRLALKGTEYEATEYELGDMGTAPSGVYDLASRSLCNLDHAPVNELVSQPSPSGDVDSERVAVLTAHRVCHGAEHDPLQGRLHGHCIVCGVPWPCGYAGEPSKVSGKAEQRLRELAAASLKLCEWVPDCSKGSSGYIRKERVQMLSRAALQESPSGR